MKIWSHGSYFVWEETQYDQYREIVWKEEEPLLYKNQDRPRTTDKSKMSSESRLLDVEVKLYVIETGLQNRLPLYVL